MAKKILCSVISFILCAVIAFVSCYFAIPDFNAWVKGKITDTSLGGNTDDDKVNGDAAALSTCLTSAFVITNAFFHRIVFRMFISCHFLLPLCRPHQYIRLLALLQPLQRRANAANSPITQQLQHCQRWMYPQHLQSSIIIYRRFFYGKKQNHF